MSRARPFLGETTDRDKAFHGIVSFEIAVEQDPFQMYANDDRRRKTRYTKSTVTRYLNCLNPRCRQGGLDLQQMVNFWPAGQHRVSCGGHEGTPQGRRRGDPCDNVFIATLTKTESK